MVQSDKALQNQIRQLEALLKKSANNTCADCPGKTPRWASITFGTFVCLRCSGQHRAMGVHITKIKSVNLDKWPEGKVETFQNLSNNLVNSYWEANLPQNYQKPGPQASTSEVTRFLQEKYVNKRWADKDMRYDPLYLYENKRSRFDKFVKRAMNRANGGDSESEEEAKTVTKPSKTKLPKAAPTRGAPQPLNKAQSQNQAPAAPTNAPDLISLAPATSSNSAPAEDGFGLFNSAPVSNQDDGFSDFQAPGQNPAPVQGGVPQQPNTGNNQQHMINNLLNIMNQNPSAGPTSAKYAALESMNDFDTPQQRQQKMEQLRMMQMQGLQAQQQTQPQVDPFTGQPNQAAGGNGGFQPNFFNSAMQQQMQYGQQQPQGQQQLWSATFNTGASAQQQQPQSNDPFSNFGQQPTQQPQQPSNMFSGMQQQPQFNTGGMGGMGGFSQPQQPPAQNFGGFGGFQSAAPSQPAQANQQPSGQYYGGLVDLSTKGNGSMPGSFVNPQQQNTVQTQARQEASFGGLVKW